MSLTLEEARARAQALTVACYEVHLDLTDQASFGSTTRVQFSCAGQTDGQFIELAGALTLKAVLNSVELPPDLYGGGRISLPSLRPENDLVIEARLPYVTDGDGMHTFTDPADGKRYVSAYCGMDLASHVFACFDQPDLKASIALTVEADPEWTVLANGVGSREADRWHFTTTPPVPTYLFVVCAGPWASVSFEHAGLPFGWHARASLRDRLERDAADLREITVRCFDHYTETFAEPYAFDSYDQIFVPGLNWGAMETAGCVTFRDEYLTRGEPTAVEQLARASVIAHEMAHMWFGDLVTMRWWEDSWLNESFADYMGYQVAAEYAGFDRAWVGWALERKPTAYVADARRSTHPVAEDTEAMTDVATAFGNFDMITYAKGNAVLRQLVTWLGEEYFLVGVNAYLSGHAFGNASLADFLAALAGVSDRDTGAWAEAWLRTTGFDTIRVGRDGAGVPVLRREGTRPHRFRIGAYDDHGILLHESTVDLGDAPVALPQYAGRAVIPNSQDETYARLHLDDRSWQLVVARLAGIADPLTRAMLWMHAVDRTRVGGLPVSALVDLVDDQLPMESDSLIVEEVLDVLLHTIRGRWASPTELPRVDAKIASTAETLLATGRPDLRLASLRALLATTNDADGLASWLDTETAPDDRDLPADERWVAVRRLAELGHVDEAMIDAELARDRSDTGHLGALRTRAAMPTRDAKAAAWAAMVDPATSNREYDALADGMWTPAHGALLGPWLDRYLADSPALARVRGHAFSQAIGRCFPFVALPVSGLMHLRDTTAATLTGDVPTVLRRSWNDRLDDLDVALRVRSVPAH